MAVLTELKNRGVADVFFLVCDGLKGLPHSVAAVWPATIVQTCIIHLIGGSIRYASRKYWEQLAADLKPIYQAVNAEAAAAALNELDTSGVPGIRRSSGYGAAPGPLRNSPFSARPRATSRSFRFRFCEERRKRSKASSGVISSRSIKIPLAWPMTSRDSKACCRSRPRLSRVLRSSTARDATEACAAKMSPISCALSLNAYGMTP